MARVDDTVQAVPRETSSAHTRTQRASSSRSNLSVKMAHALAGMMLDEHFVNKLYSAKNATELLAALDRNLESAP